MKTRALTRLLADTSAPALLLKDNSREWSNSAFDQLPANDREQIEHWGQRASDALLVCSGTLFERLTAGDHTLVIASGHRAASQQRQLLQSLIPQLQQGANPFFVLPQRLCELLDWQAAAACTQLNAQQLTLVGHWTDGEQQPPQTLELNTSLAAQLYAPHQPPCVHIREWSQPTRDPLLPPQGVWLGQPIMHPDGNLLGHLAVWDQAPRANLADSIHLLQLCADLVAAWLPPQETDSPETGFIPDALTRLPLRDALDAALVGIEHAYPQQDHLLALIDIDGLSRINAHCGQQEGDRVLCTFADKLRHMCRPGDQLFRLGGDEFVLLLPSSRQGPQLQKRLEQISRSMAEQLQHPFTLSTGFALLSDAKGSSDQLMLLANTDLQKAKQKS